MPSGSLVRLRHANALRGRPVDDLPRRYYAAPNCPPRLLQHPRSCIGLITATVLPRWKLLQRWREDSMCTRLVWHGAFAGEDGVCCRAG